MTANALSEKILLAVKMQQDTSTLQASLSDLKTAEIEKQLDNDHKKKAFWINIYNAYFQILRKERNIVKPDIYKKRLFTVGSQKLSLDDVEHGILRKYRYKYSLGFFANIFTSKLIMKLSVETLDYRIHFALNCGAKSCPPIAFYKVINLDAQLDLATQAFLEGESEYDEDKKILYTTALFKWFLADFGGTSGIKDIYKKQIGKDLQAYTIKYKEYSWEEALDNFS